MAVGIKISKPGFDVKTATPEQLYLDTNTPLLKVAYVINDHFVVNAGDLVGTIYSKTYNYSTLGLNPGISYVPIAQVQAQFALGAEYIKIVSEDIVTNKDIFVDIFISSTQVTVKGTKNLAGASGNYNFHGYIYYDQGQ